MKTIYYRLALSPGQMSAKEYKDYGGYRYVGCKRWYVEIFQCSEHQWRRKI